MLTLVQLSNLWHCFQLWWFNCDGSAFKQIKNGHCRGNKLHVESWCGIVVLQKDLIQFQGKYMAESRHA